VTASIVLTFAFLAVGISFFAPYWMSNVTDDGIVPSTSSDRGLWAQCGLECYWFWEDGYSIQTNIFTPFRWHLATQVLYFIGAAIILICEIFARVQLCCSARTVVYILLSVVLFVSALIQVAAVATFGAGASRHPYYAISDPRVFTDYLGHAYNSSFTTPYLGWSYWMAVVGAILTVVSAIFFMLAGSFGKTSAAKY